MAIESKCLSFQRIPKHSTTEMQPPLGSEGGNQPVDDNLHKSGGRGNFWPRTVEKTPTIREEP